jgi:hypothetical protein
MEFIPKGRIKSRQWQAEEMAQQNIQQKFKVTELHFKCKRFLIMVKI